jgi:hypothetical protein
MTAAPAKLAIGRCKRSGTPFKTCRNPTVLFLLTYFVDVEELEERRDITKSKACRMPTNGSRQGMMAGLEMVGHGHVASL